MKVLTESEATKLLRDRGLKAEVAGDWKTKSVALRKATEMGDDVLLVVTGTGQSRRYVVIVTT